MKINTRVRYAVRLMADIARHSSGEPVPLKEVAERQGLSKLYLSQLAVPLRNASLLKSVWGNKGGYVLGHPANEITMLDIIEAVDGPVSVIDCALTPESCDRSDYCDCISVWRDINEGIIRTLEKYTLEDLIVREEAAPKLTEPCASAASASGGKS
jgi:Rrf2 family cysteine metabolism transcriptional repressor